MQIGLLSIIFCFSVSRAAEQVLDRSPRPLADTLFARECLSEFEMQRIAESELKNWVFIRDRGEGKLEADGDEYLLEKKAKKTGNQPVQKATNNPLTPIWNPKLTDEEMLRYGRMAQWSAAAYCSSESLLSWTCGPRCEGSTVDTHVALYFKSSITDTVGFIAIYSDLEAREDQIVISFRGSVSFQNWIENFRFAKEASPWPDRDFPNARVHTGFLDSYSDISTTIRSSIVVLTKRYPDSRIIVTGHSLGGAVATLCATDLKFHLGYSSKIELVTYHSPRVGNAEYSEFIEKIFQTAKVDPQIGNYMTRRFTNRDDPLCHLPPHWIDYKHITQEVWVNLENQTVACDPTTEDPNCSNSVLMPDDLFSHFYIWNVNFGVDCSV